jgi:lipopolysaccharide assembly protein A
MQGLWLVSLFFALVIALFAIQNTAPVPVNFLFWRVEGIAIAVLVLAATAFGALLTYLLGVARRVRSHITTRGNRSTIQDQDALIAQLREKVRELEADNDRLRGRSSAAPLSIGGESLPPPEPSQPLSTSEPRT